MSNINFDDTAKEQDINVLFNMINNMSGADAVKAVEKITNNGALLDKLAYNCKYARVQVRARKKLQSINNL